MISPFQTSERNLSEAAFLASEKLFLNSAIRVSEDCVARVAHALASQLAILRIRAKKTCFPAGDKHIHPSFGNELAISLNVEKLSGHWHKATIDELGARWSIIFNEGLLRYRKAVIMPIRYSKTSRSRNSALRLLKYFHGLATHSFSL